MKGKSQLSMTGTSYELTTADLIQFLSLVLVILHHYLNLIFSEHTLTSLLTPLVRLE